MLVSLAVSTGCPPTYDVHYAGERRDRIEEAKREAVKVPGPRQVVALAEAIELAFAREDYKDTPALLQSDIAFAIAQIDRAIPSAGLDASMLVAWRANLLLYAGDIPNAISEAERSMRMGPTKIAAMILVTYYGRTHQPAKVGPICAATLPALNTDDDQIFLIDLCREHSNAASEDAALAWMSPQWRTWYDSYRARERDAEVEESRQHAIARASQQRCWSSCEVTRLQCQNDCGRRQHCQNRCFEIERACNNGC